MYFFFFFFQKRINIRKLELKQNEHKMLFLPFSNSLLIICGVNLRPVSKSTLAILITVLSLRAFTTAVLHH